MSGYNLDQKLVIGLASSAIFDLDESDSVFKLKGEKAYRDYQRNNEDLPLDQGVAFHFIKRLLSLNEISPEDSLVEVILLSKNDPDTGYRVMNSIDHYQLPISRAIFLQGRSPHQYIEPLSISLFLSANEKDVRKAIQAGCPAGLILKGNIQDKEDDQELRVAFDFDGVLADDSSEKIYAEGGIDEFKKHESDHATTPINEGPLKNLLAKLSAIQHKELTLNQENPSYEPKLRISIVTARNAPAHKRVIHTIRSWGIETINEAFFLGGIEKKKVLDILNPHIFFDDQRTHLDLTAETHASVLVPFGVRNQKK